MSKCYETNDYLKIDGKINGKVTCMMTNDNVCIYIYIYKYICIINTYAGTD